MNFHSYFHFKWIQERERDRASVREGEACTHRSHAPAPFARTSASQCCSHTPAPSIAIDALRDRAVDRNHAKCRSRSARCFARSRSMARSSDWSSWSTAPSNPVERQSRSRPSSGFCPCFSGFVFSFFFSKHQKIFFGIFLKYNQTH